jgi:hypothetical protein
LDNREVKIVVDEEYLNLKKAIFRIESTVTDIKQHLISLESKVATKDDINSINTRIDNLVKGMSAAQKPE